MPTTFETDSKGRKYIYKSPGARLPYTVDLNDATDPWLTLGATIVSAVFSCPDASITLGAQSHTTTEGTIILSGGTEDSDYVITMTWTDSNDNIDSRFFIVKVRQRSAG